MTALNVILEGAVSQGTRGPEPQLFRGYTVLRGALWSTVPHLESVSVRGSCGVWLMRRLLAGRGSAQLVRTFVFQKPWSGFLYWAGSLPSQLFDWQLTREFHTCGLRWLQAVLG